MDVVKHFLTMGLEHLARFCFMMYDYYSCPELVEIQVSNGSLLCSYEHHALVFGEPKRALLNAFIKKEDNITITLIYDDKWFPIVEDLFKDFQLVEKSVLGRDYNIFLCMELEKDEFNRYRSTRKSSNYKSQKLNVALHSDLLSIKRQIHLSRGIGGVGVLETDKIIGLGFAPHVVQKEDISFAIIRDIWVDPSFRGKGLGTDITSHLCDLLIQTGIERVFLWVEKENTPAVKIYQKLGFRVRDKVLATRCRVNKHNS
ncbi:MAG: GNAT family N-acetyltransferase [Candidatus Heimdallarchaeaceae archaeon]